MQVRSYNDQWTEEEFEKLCQADSPGSPQPPEATKDSCSTKDPSEMEFSNTLMPAPPPKEPMILSEDIKGLSTGKVQRPKESPPKRGRGRPKRAANEVPLPAVAPPPADLPLSETEEKLGRGPVKEIASITSSKGSLPSSTCVKQEPGPHEETASITSDATLLAAAANPVSAKEAIRNAQAEVSVEPASLTLPGTSLPRTRGRKTNPADKPRRQTRKQKALSSNAMGSEVNSVFGIQRRLESASDRPMIAAIAQEKSHVNTSSGNSNVPTSACEVIPSSGLQKGVDLSSTTTMGPQSMEIPKNLAEKPIGSSPQSAHATVVDVRLDSDVTQKPCDDRAISSAQHDLGATINVESREMQKPSESSLGFSLQSTSMALPGSDSLPSCPVKNLNSENLTPGQLVKSADPIMIQEEKAPDLTSEEKKSQVQQIATTLAQVQCSSNKDGNPVPVVIKREPDNRASVTRKKAAAREPKNRSSSSTAACERRARLAGLKQAEGVKKRESRRGITQEFAIINEQASRNTAAGDVGSELSHNLKEKIPDVQMITSLNNATQEVPSLRSMTRASVSEAVSSISQVIDTHQRMVSDVEKKAAQNHSSSDNFDTQSDALHTEGPSTVLRTAGSIESSLVSTCSENLVTHAKELHCSSIIHENPLKTETQENTGNNPRYLNEIPAGPVIQYSHQNEKSIIIKQDDGAGDPTGTGVSPASFHTDVLAGTVVEKSEEIAKLSTGAPVATEAVEKISEHLKGIAKSEEIDKFSVEAPVATETVEKSHMSLCPISEHLKLEEIGKLSAEALLVTEMAEKSSIPTCMIPQSLMDTVRCPESKSSEIHVHRSNVENASETYPSIMMVDCSSDLIKPSDVPHNISMTENVCKAPSGSMEIPETCTDIAHMVDDPARSNDICTSIVTMEIADSCNERVHCNPVLPGLTSKQDDDLVAGTCNPKAFSPANTMHGSSLIADSCIETGYSDVPTLPSFSSKEDDDSVARTCGTGADEFLPVSNKIVSNSCMPREFGVDCTGRGQSDVPTLSAGFTSKQDDSCVVGRCNANTAPPVILNQASSSELIMDVDNKNASTASTDLEEGVEGPVRMDNNIPGTAECNVEPSNFEILAAGELQPLEADITVDIISSSNGEEPNGSELQASVDKAQDMIPPSSNREVSDSELQPRSDDTCDYVGNKKEDEPAAKSENSEPMILKLPAISEGTSIGIDKEDVHACHSWNDREKE